MPNSFVTPWTISHQAPLVLRISQARILEWVLPFPSPGDLPNPGIKPTSPALTGGFFTIGATRDAQKTAKSQLIWQSHPLPPQHSRKQDPRVTLYRQRAPHLGPRSDHTPGLQTRVPSLADFELSSAHMKSELETPSQGKISNESSDMTTPASNTPPCMGCWQWARALPMTSIQIPQPHPPCPSLSCFLWLLSWYLFCSKRKKDKVPPLQMKSYWGQLSKRQNCLTKHWTHRPDAASSLCWKIKTDPWDWLLRKLSNHEQG